MFFRSLLFIKSASLVDILLLFVANMFLPYWVAFGLWYIYFVFFSNRLMTFMLSSSKDSKRK